MTKPTSRCVDIRQEHPLLDKFKEWYGIVSKNIGTPYHYSYYGYRQGDYTYCFPKHLEIGVVLITLDQRRERRGKEYYGWTKFEQQDVETKQDKLEDLKKLGDNIVNDEYERTDDREHLVSELSQANYLESDPGAVKKEMRIREVLKNYTITKNDTPK